MTVEKKVYDDVSEVHNKFNIRTNTQVNKTGLKKFLYLEASDLKTTYNEIINENKKLETKLKQIEKDKARVLKQLELVKDTAGGQIFKEQLNHQENPTFSVLNQNPNELKQRIRDKREVYEEHCNFFEDLKVKTKTDNLLYLANQCIFQQKLLLNTKQRLLKLKRKIKKGGK